MQCQYVIDRAVAGQRGVQDRPRPMSRLSRTCMRVPAEDCSDAMGYTAHEDPHAAHTLRWTLGPSTRFVAPRISTLSAGRTSTSPPRSTTVTQPSSARSSSPCSDSLALRLMMRVLESTTICVMKSAPTRTRLPLTCATPYCCSRWVTLGSLCLGLHDDARGSLAQVRQSFGPLEAVSAP